jgi:hypothetical protein
MVRLLIPGVLLMLGVLLSGCSSTSLTDSWQAPDFHRKDMDNVLVVGVTSNVTNRILFERGFVEALQDKGIRATASYDVMGDATPTKESVTAYVQKSGIGYVIATHYGGTQITKEVVPESVRTYVVGPAWPSYDGYWDQATYTMVRDSYVDETNEVMLTTSIFDAKTKQAVWVGRSKTFELRSINYEANDLAHLIVDKIGN